MNKKSLILKKLTFITAAAALTISTAFASFADNLSTGSQSYRINVLNAVGVADASYISEAPCTRAYFAKMLVLASAARESATAMAASSAANDVPASYDKSGYIKTALTNGWMRTRLGGIFAPEDGVTLSDAARAALAMLGYEDSDMGANVTAGRISKFKALKLNEGVKASNASDVLTYTDAVNVIYNLLRTTSKNSNSIYGTAIKLALSSTGNELNVTEAMESSMTGPVLIKSEGELPSLIPIWGRENLNIYYNGTNSGTAGTRYISSQLNYYGWVIIYYNEGSNTIWAYGNDTGGNTYHCVRGTVNTIYYDGDDIASPSSVVVDNTEYDLNTSEVRFMFSVNGDVKVGDQVILICKSNTSFTDSDDTDYYAIAVVEFYPGSDNTYSNTIFASDATKYVAVDSSGNRVN
ncbi:MAG: hypothetical protein Q4E57_04695 [Eubacteriales bacterium]|nr:hypothetical protein [Eubacteriales bacterium]